MYLLDSVSPLGRSLLHRHLQRITSPQFGISGPESLNNLFPCYVLQQPQ